LYLISSIVLGVCIISQFWVLHGSGVARAMSPLATPLSASRQELELSFDPQGNLQSAIAPFIIFTPQNNRLHLTLKSTTASADTRWQSLLNQGQMAYESGHFDEAATILEQVLQEAQQQGHPLEQAIALSNLALIRGQQGKWAEANQLILNSVSLLEAAQPAADANVQSVLAQTLNVQGRLELGQGQADTAYHTWGRAATLFRKLGNSQGEVSSQISQARALQAQGYHRRAADEILLPLEARLQNQPDSLIKVMSLLSLGRALQTIESLDSACRVIKNSLQIAQRLKNPEAIAATQLSLGNILYDQAIATGTTRTTADERATAQENLNAARDYYQQVIQANESQPQIHQFWAMLNLLKLLTETATNVEGTTAAVQFWSFHIQPQLDRFPANQDGIYARLNLVDHLSCLKRPEVCGKSFPASATPSWNDIQQILLTAQQQSEALGNRRTQAYVLGYLGAFYENTGQLDQAKQLTDQGLFLARSVNATDIVYRWYEQLGRLEEQRNPKAAIAAYFGAVETLKTLRSDLVSVNPEVQFSFKESIEPIHRKLVSLLLAPNPEGDNPEQLNQARDVIESLRLEELNNFLRAACLDAKDVKLEQVVDQQNVAVIYPIILDKRIEILARLPQQPLRRYTSQIEKADLTTLINQLQFTIGSKTLAFLQPAQQMYDLLIRPLAADRRSLAADLAASKSDTLVFIPDGELRNLPMAALFDGDGKKYLIEQYAIAIAPGLQLVDPRPLQSRHLRALTFGLTEARSGFPALQNVKPELEAISKTITSKPELDQNFTREQFRDLVIRASEPIIHLATHAQFSSQLDNTFILSWDGKISINDLSQWIRQRNHPIELLVMSACETAAGDQRAALGLAGMAVRAGARSTLASLWQVDDQATSEMMQQFYQELASPQPLSKAKALQNVQLAILRDRPEFSHPYFWAPFILLGNWL
jgi:CHAT domain-containing protein